MSVVQHLRGPTTARLIQRAFEPRDAEAMFALNGNPEVMRHTGEAPLTSVEEAREAIREYPDFRVHGYGRWACELRSEDRIIGFAGLKYLAELDEVDLGYRFLPEYWGRGLATEAGAACLDFGFETLRLPKIIALVLPANPASIRVLSKLGFEADGEIDYEDQPGVLKFVRRP